MPTLLGDLAGSTTVKRLLFSPREPNCKEVGQTMGKRSIMRSTTCGRNSNGRHVERVRTPLRTAYESFTPRASATSDVVRIATKRERPANNRTQTPKRKKIRKSRISENDDDESVIVLSDDDEVPSVIVDSGSADMIPLVDPSAEIKINSGKSSGKTTRKRPINLERRQDAFRRLKKIVKKTMADNLSQDVEIVWSSDTALPKSSSVSGEDNPPAQGETDTGREPPATENEIFIVDAVGDQSLLITDVLLPEDSQRVKKPNTKKRNGQAKKRGKVRKKKGEGVKKKEKAKKNAEDEKKEKAKKNAEDEKKEETPSNLREIIIDGCNVAMAHTNRNAFSEQGLKIALDYFRGRGHKVTIFLPQHKRGKDRHMIEKWSKEGIVVFTPSRKIANKQITPYDDRFILEYATKCQGIVISSDQYRDLWAEKPEWRETIEKRLLPPTFVGDYLMFPDDPLGKFGPRLNAFLRF
ncbi:endoribonuclease ZC3H12A-like isoform X2 [Diachasmimorpha longicaudata]|uniref:endoribonuclease ZC3H12A-like isoform X2 n=1 Tax=Diachasmimorpha longicaudata TaxID=58733 RepID=UPI0030B91344